MNLDRSLQDLNCVFCFERTSWTKTNTACCTNFLNFKLNKKQWETAGCWLVSAIWRILILIYHWKKSKEWQKNKFKIIIKTRIEVKAFVYLNEKWGSKGKEVEYSEISMAQYLLPNSTGLPIEDKRKIFSIRNRMIELSTNFPSKSKIEQCVCGKIEEMEHIYSCNLLNKKQQT